MLNHNHNGTSEADAVDGVWQAPTSMGANENECGCQEPGCLDCATDHATFARIASLTLTVRDLEAGIARRDADLAKLRTDLGDARWEVAKGKVMLRIASERCERYKNDALDAHVQVTELTDENARKDERFENLQRDMAGTVEALRIMTEMAEHEGDSHASTSVELSDMLDTAHKREDKLLVLVQGIRALCTSDSLTDEERVALILRMSA